MQLSKFLPSKYSAELRYFCNTTLKWMFLLHFYVPSYLTAQLGKKVAFDPLENYHWIKCFSYGYGFLPGEDNAKVCVRFPGIYQKCIEYPFSVDIVIIIEFS